MLNPGLALEERRKIIHIDMDCFYAAVEIRDNPRLQGKPVAIGGTTERGVICTCNYEARRYGLHSAMAVSQALRKCPTLILLPVDMKKYKQTSNRIHRVLNKYTRLIEPISIDEAFLDVTDSGLFRGSATWIASAIRKEIEKEEAITASAGVAPNKFLAKVASDWNKPNGQCVIVPSKVEDFIASLSVEKIYGVGKVKAKRLKAMGVGTCRDLQQYDLVSLIRIFGSYGVELYSLSRGIDNRAVEPKRVRKSVSVEETYSKDLESLSACREKVTILFEELKLSLKRHYNRKISTQFVKVKFSDFTQTTAEKRRSQLQLSQFQSLLEEAKKREGLPVRLLGIGVKFEDAWGYTQLEFWPPYALRASGGKRVSLNFQV